MGVRLSNFFFAFALLICIAGCTKRDESAQARRSVDLVELSNFLDAAFVQGETLYSDIDCSTVQSCAPVRKATLPIYAWRLLAWSALHHQTKDLVYLQKAQTELASMKNAENEPKELSLHQLFHAMEEFNNPQFADLARLWANELVSISAQKAFDSADTMYLGTIVRQFWMAHKFLLPPEGTLLDPKTSRFGREASRLQEILIKRLATEFSAAGYSCFSLWAINSQYEMTGDLAMRSEVARLLEKLKPELLAVHQSLQSQLILPCLAVAKSFSGDQSFEKVSSLYPDLRDTMILTRVDAPANARCLGKGGLLSRAVSKSGDCNAIGYSTADLAWFLFLMA